MSPLCPNSPTPVCVSLDDPEHVDNILTFLSGYDTLEYSWVKATVVSVRLRILFVTLQNFNNDRLQPRQRGMHSVKEADLEPVGDGIAPVLVLCNVTNKIRKRTDTAVAFIQEYSGVLYPLRNVSTLPTGSSSSTDTHTGVGGEG